MPLRFNNTEITQVYFNGVEKMTLQYNDTSYFGKRFSLMKNTSTGVTLTVSRTSSPNQRAATGSVATGNTKKILSLKEQEKVWSRRQESWLTPKCRYARTNPR